MKRLLQIIFVALIAALAAISVALIFPAYHKHKTMLLRQQEVTNELRKHTNECIILRKKLHAVESSSEEVERIAREKFNYCKPNETVYKFKEEKID
jgi:cell division protein FtsB